jgi:hypothetical protein
MDKLGVELITTYLRCLNSLSLRLIHRYFISAGYQLVLQIIYLFIHINKRYIDEDATMWCDIDK